jgi:hypothetical protein
MHTLVLFAVLHAAVSIPPIRVLQPYPDVKCPQGYSLWWPAGKEFENDRYAQCVKFVASATKASAKSAHSGHKITTNVSLQRKSFQP